MRMQTVVDSHFLTCFTHSMSHLSLSLRLSNPLHSFSASVCPVTKGGFLFKGPEKPLGTQSTVETAVIGEDMAKRLARGSPMF